MNIQPSIVFYDDALFNYEQYSFFKAETPWNYQLMSIDNFFAKPDHEENLLGEEQNLIWCTDYTSDIIQTLKEVEIKRRKIQYKSPQTEYRMSLIYVIKYCAQKFGLGETTVHLAVYLLDVFMDTYIIMRNKLNMVGLTCLLLAAKIEERDHNIPKLQKLSEICNTPVYSFKITELKLLSFFDWYLLFPTAATYLEYFTANVLTKDEIRRLIQNRLEIITEADILKEAHSLVYELLDLTLRDQILVQVSPSVLASACLAATRTHLGLNAWNTDLHNITGYEFSKLQTHCNFLLRLKKKTEIENKIKSTPDSGCMLSSDSDSDELKTDNRVATNDMQPLVKRRRIN